LSRHSVLYIEDNPVGIRLIERILRLRDGIDLIVATTGQIGIDLAIEAGPSLILLDRRLPDISGDEVLRRLKSLSSTATIPVVIFSGDAGREQVKEYARLGAAAFMAKPIVIKEFLGLVDRFCAG